MACLAMLLISCVAAVGQIGDKVVKLYGNFGLMTDREVNRYGSIVQTEKRYDYQIGYPTFAIGFGSHDDNYQEFELSQLIINRSSDEIRTTVDGEDGELKAGTRTTAAQVALRYEHNMIIFLREESRLRYYAGISYNPYFSSSSFTPINTAFFPTSQRRIGLVLSFVPRLNYYITPKWFLDLNILVNVVDVYREKNKTDNPQVPASERVTKTTEFTFMPRYFQFRLGVGLRI